MHLGNTNGQGESTCGQHSNGLSWLAGVGSRHLTYDYVGRHRMCGWVYVRIYTGRWGDVQLRIDCGSLSCIRCRMCSWVYIHRYISIESSRVICIFTYLHTHTHAISTSKKQCRVNINDRNEFGCRGNCKSSCSGDMNSKTMNGRKLPKR